MGNGVGDRPINRELLAAAADGEFGPETARMVIHLANNPEDQAFVKRIGVERELFARVFGPIANEPMPERILAMIDGAAPRSKRLQNFSFRRWGWFTTGLASGVAAAAVVAFAVQIGRPPEAASGSGLPGTLAVGPVESESVLALALDARFSGDEVEISPEARLRIAASFVDGRDRLCREVLVVQDAANRIDQAVACTEGVGWSVEIAVGSEVATDADAYAPASGPGGRAIERLLDEIEAGPALSPEEEAAAHTRGWRR